MQLCLGFFNKSFTLQRTSQFRSPESDANLHIYWISDSLNYESYTSTSEVKAFLAEHPNVFFTSYQESQLRKPKMPYNQAHFLL